MKATYTYLADGSKYKTVNASGGGYDYVGSFKYNRNGSNITLESVASAGGRMYKTSSGYEVRYFVADHLGSTRIVANSSGTVLEQNDYMPYGERHSNSVLATSGNPYLYNGKESQKDFGVNYIDSEARFQRLDGSFNSMDPLCEEKPYISPYVYCGANPIARVDTDGLDWYSYEEMVTDKNGMQRIYTRYAYTTIYKSQKDLDRAGINGVYLGRTFEADNNYYSFLGYKYDLTEKNTDVVKLIDDAMINYIDFVEESAYNESATQKSTDFSNINQYNGSIFVTFENVHDDYVYAEGRVTLLTMGNNEAMKAKLESTTAKYKRWGGYTDDKSKRGYNLYIKNNKGAEVVVVTFPTEALYNKFTHKFNNLVR